MSRPPLYVATTLRDPETENIGIAFVLNLVLLAPLYLWSGLVIKTIWNWFVPTTFVGMPYLTIAQSVGLGILVSVLTHRRVAQSNKRETPLEMVFYDTGSNVIMGVIALVVGYIVQSF